MYVYVCTCTCTNCVKLSLKVYVSPVPGLLLVYREFWGYFTIGLAGSGITAYLRGLSAISFMYLNDTVPCSHDKWYANIIVHLHITGAETRRRIEVDHSAELLSLVLLDMLDDHS